MIDDVILSKYSSLTLRHKPDFADVRPNSGGWVNLEQLVKGLKDVDVSVSSERILDILASSDKKRFTLPPDGLYVRAAQGHSIDVDLALEPRRPPDILFHGTSVKAVETILDVGLTPQTRRHVHLSTDMDIAHRVGSRHGKPVVLLVDAKEMHQDGYTFWQADNGVWLTDDVPTPYIRKT